MKWRIISISLSYQQEFVKKFGSNYYKETFDMKDNEEDLTAVGLFLQNYPLTQIEFFEIEWIDSEHHLSTLWQMEKLYKFIEQNTLFAGFELERQVNFDSASLMVKKIGR